MTEASNLSKLYEQKPHHLREDLALKVTWLLLTTSSIIILKMITVYGKLLKYIKYEPRQQNTLKIRKI